MERFFFTIILVMLVLHGIAQDDDRIMKEFDPDFKFKEGFFRSFEDVKNNDPIPLVRLITNYDHSSSDFFNKILQEKRLGFFDVNGVPQDVNMNDIWGFSRNGVLYIRLSEGFHRITIIGQICHFVARITTYDVRRYDPYYYDPYYYYNLTPRTTKDTEMKQYLLDWETGELMDYDVKSVEVLLMKDPELHDEYAGLRSRKKKQLKFFYIRKFNERNPVYLPVDKF